MTVKIIKGNIFTSECQTIVNTVNCVGVMGAGIALEYRLRYPEMYLRYVQLCKEDKINIGLLWLHKAPDRWVLNFPTKRDWKNPSKIEYLQEGLNKFVATYKDKGIESIAFPLLGADKGGIPEDQSLNILKSSLENIDVEVEIYLRDATAKDDLLDKIKNWLSNQSESEVPQVAGLKRNQIVKINEALASPDIVQLNQLAAVREIGIETLERIFALAIVGDSEQKKSTTQKTLF